MPAKKKESSWDRIQTGVRDAEKLITQRDYNSAMVKCRQTLEYMVKQLAARARILDNGDLKGLIDDLYINRWISKSTYEHYNTIRIAGNKAVHEGYDNAYDATQVYQLLSQEVYRFSDEFRNAPRGNTPKKSDQKRSDSSAASSSSRSRRRPEGARKSRIDSVTLIKLLVPVLCVILLILIIWMLRPHRTVVEETTPAAVTFAETTAAVSPATAAPPAETAVVYRTTSNLNVRREPSTDSDVLGQLRQNSVVEYIEAVNENWARILYEGQEAYVASQYLTTD